jgi:uncharacterized coiled-coil DUF342 family protein
MLVVQRSVNVVALATDSLKAQLLAEVDAAMEELQLQGQQLEFRSRRVIAELQTTNVHRLVEARREIDEARERQDVLHRELVERRRQIEALAPDTPVARGQLESIVELREGDNLADKLRPAEILVRDDIIISISGQ